MNYSKGLNILRKSADGFDYNKYVADKEAGKFTRKTKTTEEIAREGLMRRKSAALDTPDMGQVEEESDLGPLSERFLEIRNRRSKSKGMLSEVVDTLKGSKEQSPSNSDGLMSPKGSGSFKDKLIESESSGRTDAEYKTKDGNRYVGSGQFGEDRLTDFKKQTGTEFTQDDFKKDPVLQEEVMNWHLKDLDKQISKTSGSDKFDRDGLRAVAHLGGVGGMRRFVASGGKHNPADELGTSLRDYYQKFKG